METYNPFTHPICFTMAERLAPSGWIGHIPFAMFLVELTRPKIVVELGAHHGVSYCAFCQAVKSLELDTRCYAIDTWTGDAHSGFYGEEVLSDLRAHHDPLYGSFSRLIQSTFEEAVEHFENGSIDLLHIDGFHTYDQVKQDFETWLPKMSDRGVIIFHDINVRERDFGIWKFWSEIKKDYQHFEFTHSHGLGLLVVGHHPPVRLAKFLKQAQGRLARVREFFHQLGLRLELAQEVQNLKTQVQKHSDQIVERQTAFEAQLAQQDADLERGRAQLAIYEAQLAQRAEEWTSAQTHIAQQDADLGRGRKQLAIYEEQLAQRTEAWTSAQAQIAQQDADLERGRKQLASNEEQLAQRTEAWTSAQTQIAQQEVDLGRGRAQLAIYEEQLVQRAAEVTSAQTQIALQEVDLGSGRKQLASYEEQLAQRTEAWTSAQTQIGQQEANLERGRKQLASYEEQLAQQSVELRETRDQVARYELEVVQQTAESAKDRARLSDYKAQLDQRVAELTKTRGQIAAYQAEVARRAAESSKERARLALLRDPRSVSLNDVAPFSKLAAFAAGKSGVIHSALDAPDNVLCASSYVEISGWAFSTAAPITRVEAFLDNQFLASLSYEIERPDVVAAFSEEVPLKCGFKERVMLNGMTGLRVLTVRVFDRNGNTQLYIRELQITRVPELEISDTITPRPFSINTSTVPVISVVIPVFNKSNYTFKCLRSIRDVLADSELKVEIIVVDDKSTDNTPEVLAQISGLRVVSNEENLGFIDSCNRGAAVANGQYLLFLNNDTLVSPRCFEELLETFQIKPDAGLVGAKLLYPDGSLQEAGGVIWNDASGWNFGRLDDPEKPEYCYLREVDYCSGACIMVPRRLFSQLGGFDTRYRPAYYEDTDLAFQIRKAGSRVYYQPLAQVTHFEGVTSGTDVSANVKSYQVVNQQKLRLKWADVLAKHGESGVDPYSAKERQVTKRILVIDACVLTPDQDAGSLMVFNHIKIFQSLGYKVTFAPDNLQNAEKYTADLQRIGVECLYWPQSGSIQSHLEAFGSYYDLVFIARADVAEKHIDDVRAYCRRARIIFHTVDLHFVREQRRAELENNPELAESALRRKEQELAVADKSDCTLVVSAYEEEVLLKENPRLNVGVVPLTLDMPGRQADFAERTDLLFIGGFQHTPNVDAVLHFVQSIYPLIKIQLPDVKFYIVGSKAPAEILHLAGDTSIVVTGFVPDVAPYFNRRRLSVAPLRYGAGLKGKVVTSLSYGVPMVASAIACEGIGLKDGVNVLIADDPAEFAKKVVRLYTDAALWNKLSSAGFKKVSREYSEAATRSFFERLFLSLEQPDDAVVPALKLVEQKLPGDSPPAANQWPRAKVSGRS